MKLWSDRRSVSGITAKTRDNLSSLEGTPVALLNSLRFHGEVGFRHLFPVLDGDVKRFVDLGYATRHVFEIPMALDSGKQLCASFTKSKEIV